jgi:hypothetical protein
MRQKVHNNIPHSAEVFPLSSAESGQSPPSGRFLFILIFMITKEAQKKRFHHEELGTT